MKRKSHAGITSMTLPIFVQDTSSTSGAGLGGLTSATSGLVAEYRRQGASAWTAITLGAGTLGTWSSGGFVADGSLAGAYEVGVPDAAVASGARWCGLRLYGAANMLPVLIEIELDVVDYQDATAFGLSRLDAAVSSRMATFSLPTNFASLAITAGGAVTAGTVGDKAGYSLSQAFPANFASLAITVGGAVTAGTVGDKTGYSLATAPPTAAAIATALWQDLTSSGDFTTTGSIGKLLVTNVDTNIGSRSTYAGADTAGTTTLLSRLPAALTITAGGVTVAGYASGQDPAALVLDVTASSHNLTGSIGAKVNASGAAGDPWSTALPGSYATGTAGKILGSSLTLAALLGTPRALDAIPDAQLTAADALWAALAGSVGKGSVVGTSYTVQTPSDGTVLRTFVLNSGTSPTSRV